MTRPNDPTPHPRSFGGPFAWMGALPLVALAGCGKEVVESSGAPERTVTAFLLEEGRPRLETLATGVVEPFRVSDVAFDVSGILVSAREVGEEVLGPQFDERGELLLDAQGAVVRQGDVIARIDDTRYREAVVAAKLAIASTEREIEALDIEVNEVLSAQFENAEAGLAASRANVLSARQAIESAEAELDLAETTVTRDRSLIESGAIAQSVLDESEANSRTAAANLAQASAALEAALQDERSAIASVSESRGSILVRRADRESLTAGLNELRNALTQAQTDLESCTLRAPFSGRVTSKKVARGMYVSPGQTVLELMLLSPVKVVLTASPELARQLPQGSGVPVYPDRSATDDGLVGTVFERADVADSGTRTFRIGLITPNQLLGDPGLKGPQGDSRLTDFFPVLPGIDDPTNLYVNAQAVIEEGGKTFVLRLPDFSTLATGQRFAGLQVPEVIPVSLSDEWDQIDAWALRRLAEQGELQPGDGLILNPTPAHREGVRMGFAEYALRVGDVVEVGLDADLPPTGLWVPAEALVARAGGRFLFKVEDSKAVEVSVQIGASSGDHRQVLAPELAAGNRVVLSGAAYLADGDPVRVLGDGESGQ